MRSDFEMREESVRRGKTILFGLGSLELSFVATLKKNRRTKERTEDQHVTGLETALRQEFFADSKSDAKTRSTGK